MESIRTDEQAMSYLSQKDPVLKTVIERVGPIERPGRGELFPALIRQIVGQQVSMKAARTVYSRLETLVGEVTPERILATAEDDLQQCGLSFRKVTYMLSTAKDVKDGTVKLEELHALTDDEVIQELTKLKGIGRWTAEMLLMFSMGRPNIFPIDDLGIQRGLRNLYKRELSKEWLDELLETYSPYGTTASLYIWEVSAAE